RRPRGDFRVPSIDPRSAVAAGTLRSRRIAGAGRANRQNAISGYLVRAFFPRRKALRSRSARQLPRAAATLQSRRLRTLPAQGAYGATHLAEAAAFERDGEQIQTRQVDLEAAERI